MSLAKEGLKVETNALYVDIYCCIYGLAQVWGGYSVSNVKDGYMMHVPHTLLGTKPVNLKTNMYFAHGKVVYLV